MKEYDIYNSLTQEQRSYLGSLNLISELEAQNDPDTNFGKIYGASQKNKEIIFSISENAWLKSEEFSQEDIVNGIVDSINNGLSLEKLKNMDKWEVMDLAINPYQKEEESEEM